MLFLIIALVPVNLLWGYYFYRFFRRMFETFGVNTKKKWIRVLIAVGAFGLALSSCYIWSYTCIVVFQLALFIPLVQFVNFIVKKLAKERYESDFARWKKIYGSGMIPIALSVLMILYGYWNLHHVVDTPYTIYSDKDIREEGYRVVFLADVHFGVSIDYEELLEVCEEISAADADAVILGGDIVDNATTKEEMQQVFQSFGTIKSKYGVYYLYGNHDRTMSQLPSGFSNEELVRNIEANNITILQDDVVRINGDLVLIGREDAGMGRRNGRMSVEELLTDVNSDAFLLMLDHQPNQYKENAAAGIDLILSGHTHAGQFFPLNLVYEVIKLDDAVYGHYYFDNMQAIVTSGLADWNYPVKTAGPAEYIVVDIKQSK